ncbi:MAG: N-acetyltransferase [Myxococcota bacterium]|nr:N-acetyltransferase [Myxococcota bacterium]
MPPSSSQEPTLRAMHPTDRNKIQQLGARLFSPFGDYSEALHGWLRSPGVTTTVASNPTHGLVGFALLALLRDVAGRRGAYLLGIGVEETWQRRGLGAQLLTDSLDRARRNRARWGIDDVLLEVARDNNRARELFESAGFECVEDSERSYPGGQDVIRMRMPLC